MRINRNISFVKSHRREELFLKTVPKKFTHYPCSVPSAVSTPTHTPEGVTQGKTTDSQALKAFKLHRKLSLQPINLRKK